MVSTVNYTLDIFLRAILVGQKENMNSHDNGILNYGENTVEHQEKMSASFFISSMTPAGRNGMLKIIE